MARSLPKSLGEAELRLLGFLAEREPATVREAWEEYGQSQGYVRTTILQMMERMRAKGFLVRIQSPEGWRYRTLNKKPFLLRNAVERFVSEALGGSVSPFVQYLVDAPDLTPEDVEALTALVERLKENPS
jgi:predicted transcriptional regulator